MSKNILKATAAISGALVIIVIAALLANRKTEPEVETEPEIPVQMSIEKETTHEEETTTAAVVRTTEPVTVAATETTEAETEHSYTVEELADYVLNNGINGPEREEVLGDRYDEVQTWINEHHVPPARYEEPAYDPEPAYYEGGDVLTPSAGVNYYGGIMETYYCLDMSGVVQIMRSIGYDEANYPYWVRGDGVKMFGDFVMVAADFGQFPRGSIVQTSLGTGMVCDTGAGGWNWFDIAVTWG